MLNIIISSEGEPQILDYATQQHKLFIAIATAHALQLSSNWLWQSFNAVLAQMKGGNTDTLPEVRIFYDFYTRAVNGMNLMTNAAPN